MLELTVSPKSPAAITMAFKKLSEMVKSGSLSFDTTIQLTLAPGEYHEILSYNLPNPLIMESVPGTRPEKCVLSAENCEAFHKDTENRSVFVIGSAATSVTLRGFTIENTHVKTAEDANLGNQAEALCWHNRTGFLQAQNMRFISRQDTIHVKGFSHFVNCSVTGDVDYIWGYCDTCLFEKCWIHTRADNRGDGRPAYVLQSRALNGKPGFVFYDCTFTADRRTGVSPIYIGRSSGTGTADSAERWDSIALINCTVSSEYDPKFWTDEDGTRAVYPPVGTALTGWREYGTRSILESGQNVAADVSHRSPHGYVLSPEEFRAFYADAAMVLGLSAQKSKN
jgi:pectinesterase